MQLSCLSNTPIVFPFYVAKSFIEAILLWLLVICFKVYRECSNRLLAFQLASIGRFIKWEEVKSKLISGEGTLIVEFRSRKEQIREWWTEDDLITNSPVPLPTHVRSIIFQKLSGSVDHESCENELGISWDDLFRLVDYAEACEATYVNLQTGRAQLTAVPTPVKSWLGCLVPRVKLPTGRCLKSKYPGSRVITLVLWSPLPVIAVGDVEDVLLEDSK